MNNLLTNAKQIKIVFFDIDDTLRVKNTGYMPESIHHVFKALREKGILTGIATGRNFYGVIPEIKHLILIFLLPQMVLMSLIDMAN